MSNEESHSELPVDYERVAFLLKQIRSLDYCSKYYLAARLSNEMYPKPVPGFDVDIVHACMQKFVNWLDQQVEIIAKQSKFQTGEN